MSVDAFLAHLAGVLADGGVGFAGLDRFEHDGQGVEADDRHLAGQALLVDDGGCRRRAGVEGHEDGVEVRVGGQGVLRQLGGDVLVPVGVVADDGDAAGLELLLDAVLAGVAGLVADGAAQDQRLALAAE